MSAPDAPAEGDAEAPGEATLLVSEFPPPPFYYTEAANLTPPEIPKVRSTHVLVKTELQDLKLWTRSIV